jgi:replication factor C large subunit
MVSFVDKYAPKKIADILDHSLGIQKVKDFLLNYKEHKRALMLYGPTGVGKTCSVYAIANELGFDIVQLTSEDFRDKESIRSVIGNAVTTASLFGRNKMVLVDELESFIETDSGSLSVLNDVIKTSRFPVVLIALDIWDMKLKTLRTACELVEFKRLPGLLITGHLLKIMKKENLEIDTGVLDFIVKNAKGDLRAALNDLDIFCTSGHLIKEDASIIAERNSGQDIFTAVQTVFKSEDMDKVVSALDQVDMEFNTASLWISENIPAEYKTPEEVSKAYDAMSRSDVFLGRINKRQNYGFFYYANLLATAGVSVARKTKGSSFVKYNRPTKIMKLFETKSYRSTIKSISSKVSRLTHTSIKAAEKNYLNMLRFIFKSKSANAGALAQSLGLEKAEIEFLSA